MVKVSKNHKYQRWWRKYLLSTECTSSSLCYSFIAGDGQLEVGAHWIHGQEGNVVHQWASENGLTSDELTWTQTGRNSVFSLNSLKYMCVEFDIIYCIQWSNTLQRKPFNFVSGLGNTVYLRDDGEVVAEDISDEFSETFKKLEDSSRNDFADYPGSLGQYFTEK